MRSARLVLYAASLVLALFTVRALLGQPPPLWFAVAGGAAYLGFFLVGVFHLPLGLFVDARCRGDEGRGVVALTFDDGPHPVHTRKVLEALEEASARATFFFVAKKAEEHPELVRAVVRAGHEVGSHSYAHARTFALKSGKAIQRDLTRARDVLEPLAGTIRLFRPPIGHSTPTLARIVDELDLEVIAWCHRALDGVGSSSPDAVFDRLRRGGDGCILQLHDAPEHGDHEPASVAALPRLLEDLRARGLKSVTVSELLGS